MIRILIRRGLLGVIAAAMGDDEMEMAGDSDAPIVARTAVLLCLRHEDADRALARLETLAKERGSAVGVASALPISIERIGTWARQLEGRGLMLVPLTTAMLKPKSS